ncbi:MAG: hypothetical protein JSU74_05665 [Candidatus Zixiibacteriota bacterium]|nr:MAG: hypothetical protein JSU74_05665 [candidate division Zixibacteria bacterium]
MADPKTSVEIVEDVVTLTRLINKYGNQLLKDAEENAKVGDLIKMIELKRKLMPTDPDQREFWNMLDRIRRETLGSKKSESKTKKKASRKQNEKG